MFLEIVVALAFQTIAPNLGSSPVGHVTPTQEERWIGELARVRIAGKVSLTPFEFYSLEQKFDEKLLGLKVGDDCPIAELVANGPECLQALLLHLTDSRPVFGYTPIKDEPQVSTGGSSHFGFGNEYPTRQGGIAFLKLKITEAIAKGKPMDPYAIRVGDICYMVLGRVVNRRFELLSYDYDAG
jgi:hypothetical protein